MARSADRVAERRVPLSKERVLRTAMALADQGGIDSLSMRRLAQELGVEAMSLYHYVSSKDDILNGIVEIVVAEIEVPSGGKDWRAALLGRLREAGFSANMTHHAYHALDSHIMGSTLWAAGYSALAKADPGAVQRFVQKLPVTDYPYFAEHVDQHLTKSARDGVSEFEFGLDLILDGLERVRSASSPRSSTRRTDRPIRRSRRPTRRPS